MTTRRRTLRAFTLITATAVAASVGVGLPSPAQADDDATVTIVGTSDVFDSNLVQTVIEPGFEAAYPQYDFKYVSRGTGAAIAYAKSGAASGLIVHAAALENQFVADGYSAEPYGRAIFWGDYVLLGPDGDPAGVKANAPQDIVGAYEDVAAAGESGDAEFVSRGGTPGTTVQEHAIWALTTGVTTCDVSAANGGGKSPSTVTGPCPASIPYPSWYHATGLTQGPNIVAGDVCVYDSRACYVFTDRGTFNYLDSQGSLANLDIVTRDNNVEGQLDLLVNSFHAYAIDADAFDDPDVQINSQGAADFLTWITSPEAQTAVNGFLSDGGDPPFLPSAAPSLTASDLPGRVDAGGTFAVSGQLANVVPGTPALNGVTVRLKARPANEPDAAPTAVASALTRSDGSYSITYRPRRDSVYTVAVNPITKIENDVLDPVFGDLLAGTQTSAGQVRVQSAVKNFAVQKKNSQVAVVSGRLSPSAQSATGTIGIYGSRGSGSFKRLGTVALKKGDAKFSTKLALRSGAYKVYARYADPGVIIGADSATRKVQLR